MGGPLPPVPQHALHLFFGNVLLLIDPAGETFWQGSQQLRNTITPARSRKMHALKEKITLATATYSAMIGQILDTMSLASTNLQWLK